MKLTVALTNLLSSPPLRTTSPGTQRELDPTRVEAASPSYTRIPSQPTNGPQLSLESWNTSRRRDSGSSLTPKETRSVPSSAAISLVRLTSQMIFYSGMKIYSQSSLGKPSLSEDKDSWSLLYPTSTPELAKSLAWKGTLQTSTKMNHCLWIFCQKLISSS